MWLIQRLRSTVGYPTDNGAVRIGLSAKIIANVIAIPVENFTPVGLIRFSCGAVFTNFVLGRDVAFHTRTGGDKRNKNG